MVSFLVNRFAIGRDFETWFWFLVRVKHRGKPRDRAPRLPLRPRLETPSLETGEGLFPGG